MKRAESAPRAAPSQVDGEGTGQLVTKVVSTTKRSARMLDGDTHVIATRQRATRAATSREVEESGTKKEIQKFFPLLTVYRDAACL